MLFDYFSRTITTAVPTPDQLKWSWHNNELREGDTKIDQIVTDQI